MDKYGKFRFGYSYMKFLAEMQDDVDELYASLLYGGFVYEDTRIDLYQFFDELPDRDQVWSENFDPLMNQCSSNIGSLMEYLKDRCEDPLIRDNEEPIAYIQMPEDLWDALYGESDDETAVFLAEHFEEFMESEQMDYDLTEYGRNAALIYAKREE
jgi:hypothetical protein